MEKVRSLKPGINIAPLVGYNTIRSSAMGYSAGSPSAREIKEMAKALDLAMDQGAFGISAGLAYAPGCYANKEELVSYIRLAARAGGFFSCHIRSEGRALEEAWSITPEEVASYLETLPGESRHCAELAVGALYLALTDIGRRTVQVSVRGRVP